MPPPSLSFSQQITSEQETSDWVKKNIIPNIALNDNIFLEGLMGSGKSFIAREILKTFNVTDIIPSPTFNLINTYQSEYLDEERLFYHIDFYRLDREEELFDLGIFEILSSPALVLIEWGKQFKSLQSEINKEIHIQFSKNQKPEDIPIEKKRIISWYTT